MNPKKLALAVARLLVVGALGLSSTGWGGVQPAWIRVWNAGLVHETNQLLALSLDAQGDVVLGGSSTGAAGDFDYLVLKYGPAGNLLWSSRYASLSNGNDQARGMALDGEGNIHVTGTSVTVKFDAGGSLQWSAPFGGRDIAVSGDGAAYVTGFSEVDLSTVKLSSNGSNAWVRLRDVHGLRDRSEKVVLDASGDVIVAGWSQFQCEPREGVCYARFALVKYDKDGNAVWETPFPSPPGGLFRIPVVVALASTNNGIYMCVLIDGGGFDVCRFSDQGVFEWWQTFGGASAEGVSALRVLQDGTAYLTGGKYRGFPWVSYITAKTDPLGAEEWRTYYSQTVNYGYNRAKAMALDTAGNIYVTGRSEDANGNADWATIKYNPDGKEQWVRRYDGPAHGVDEATAIAVDPSGNIYVAGTQTTTNGSTEIVVIKYVDLTSIVLQPDGSVLLRFLGAPGQSCRFEASADLATWSDIGGGVVDAGGIATFVESNVPPYATRFYRMLSP